MGQASSTEFWPLFLGALFTGLRQGDLRQLPWSAYDGKAITWRVTKRRKVLPSTSGNDRFWHFSDIPPVPTKVRYRG
jgi:hypothetical protein